MERQLILIEERQPDWRLDEHTREVGRAGVAQARAALRAALARPDAQQSPTRHAA